MISRILRAITRIFFNAMFSGSDNWMRHSSIFFYAIEVYLVFKLLHLNAFYAPLLVLILVCVYLIGSHGYGMLYVLLVSSIPAIWYFITSLPFTRSLEVSFLASLRAFTLSAWIITLIYFLNPMEIALIVRLTSRNKGAQLAFPLVWRMVPHVMSDMEASLLANELKGEKTWKGLAVTMLATKEYETMYSEGLIAKVKRFSALYWYDARALLLSVCVLSAMILILVFEIYV